MDSTHFGSQFTAEVGPCERRSHQRFAIVAVSQYIAGGTRGRASTSDISSGGVFLGTDTTLPVGAAVEVLIDWPALLEGRHRLRLVIHGQVLRSDTRGTAVRLGRYEFRLAPRCSPTNPS